MAQREERLLSPRLLGGSPTAAGVLCSGPVPWVKRPPAPAQMGPLPPFSRSRGHSVHYRVNLHKNLNFDEAPLFSEDSSLLSGSPRFS